MATFALVDSDNIVRDINRIDNEFLGFGGEFPQSESFGQAIQEKLGLTPPGSRWLQCSFTGAFRGCYPAMGDLYDPNTDTFVRQGV